MLSVIILGFDEFLNIFYERWKLLIVDTKIWDNMRHGLTITWVTREISKEALHVELGFKKILFHQNLTKFANIADRINFHVVKFHDLVGFYLLSEN